MKHVGLLCTALFSFFIVLAQKKPAPDQIYSPLFEDVQMSGIFPDNKTFVDCVPKRNPADIVKDYIQIKNNPAIRFSLRKFVEDNFIIPSSPQDNYRGGGKDIQSHIQELWTVLRRNPDKEVEGSSLLALPNPYIVPGGRFREIYYWDSYFTMLGLKESGEIQTIENMVKNFAYMLNSYGLIPNGNRSYYLSRSQPPFFSLMVELLASVKGEQVYAEFLPALETEYTYWVQGADKLKPGEAGLRAVRMPDGTVLNRYWDDETKPRQESYKEDVETATLSVRQEGRTMDFNDMAKMEKKMKSVYQNLRAGAASGWDFSSRWMADGKNLHTIETMNILPVDLNCLVLHLEQTLSVARRISKNSIGAQQMQQRITARVAAIQKYFWNSSVNFYTDYHFVKKRPQPMIMAAGMFPFCFLKNAPNGRAALAAATLKKHLLRPGGVVTTANNTGQQWDAPNGWAPLQWMTVWALDVSGQKELAKDIAQRWMRLTERVYTETGKLMEKYNVEDLSKTAGGGEYPGQDGFGWTNGVYLAMKRKYEGKK
jgi:alpha,alpha-trehalase